MRRLAVILVSLLAVTALADIPPEFRPIVAAYDLTSTSYTYPLLGNPLSGSANVKTSGSSTTVTAASGTPFADVAVGAELTIQTDVTTRVVRAVTAKASDTSITVDTAANLSGNGSTGYPFSYRPLSDGTGLTQGWIKVSQYSEKNYVFEVNTINATNITVRVECKSSGDMASPIQIYPATGGTGQCGTGVVTTAGITGRCAVVSYEPWDQCRVGFILTGDTGAQSITAGFMGRVAR
jgi:hypothetical protein